MKRPAVLVAGAAAALVLGVVWMLANANEPREPDVLGVLMERQDCPSGYQPVRRQGCSRRMANGNFEVVLEDGTTLETHGEDSPPPAGVNAAAPAQRQPVCDTAERLVFLYAHVGPSRFDEVKSQVLRFAKEMNGKLSAEAQESAGVTADLRVRCDDAGEVFVGQVASTGTTFSEVSQAARNAGYRARTEKYQMFLDSDQGPCGIANLSYDTAKRARNANNGGPTYALTSRQCWGWFVGLHEGGHTLGAVQNDAPDSSGAGHCDGDASTDVMCYEDGGGQWDPSHACAGVTGQHFDACHNDFFHPAPPPNSYLATHFNLGQDSKFVVIGAAPPPPPSTTTTVPPPTTTTTTCGFFTRLLGNC